jgi:sarcosine oxidase gamma subunit
MPDNHASAERKAVDIDFKRLRLTPGDILVVRTDRCPSPEEAAALSDQVSACLGAAGHGSTKVLVLGPDMSLEVITKTEMPR